MRRILVGLVLGMLVAAAAHGEEPPAGFTDLKVQSVGGSTFRIPEEFGRLVNVVVSGEIHYLYFEDVGGTIRIVQLGPRGAASRARSPLHLLSSSVFTVERGAPVGAP